jgi:hypothetical protein
MSSKIRTKVIIQKIALKGLPYSTGDMHTACPIFFLFSLYFNQFPIITVYKIKTAFTPDATHL